MKKFMQKGGRSASLVLVFLSIALAFIGLEETSKDDLLLKVHAIHGFILAWIIWVLTGCFFEK